MHLKEQVQHFFLQNTSCFHGDPYGLVAKLTDCLAVAQIPCLTDKLN